MMNRRLDQMLDMGIGAGLMYVFDPELGQQRREIMRAEGGDYLRRYWVQTSLLATGLWREGRLLARVLGQKGVEVAADLSGQARQRAGELGQEARSRAGDLRQQARANKYGLSFLGDLPDRVADGTVKLNDETKYLLASKLAEDEKVADRLRVRLRGGPARFGMSPMGRFPAPWLLAALGMGAGLMYFMDPHGGEQRRGRMTRSGRGLWRKASRTFAGVRGGSGAMTGAYEGPISDEKLVSRVRAQIHGFVAHPERIFVTAHRGHVVISGPIRAEQVDPLLDRLSHVRGVNSVENRLHHQQGPDNGYNGNGQEEEAGAWNLPVRLLATAAGGMLTFTGLRARNALGAAGSVFGLGLAARGLTNMNFERYLGIGGQPAAVTVHKTINIAAPIEEVYAFWRNFQNFPRFMSHVLEVTDLGQGLSQWTAEGPLGTHVKWDAIATQDVPNQALAWKSLPGSAVRNAGQVRFSPGPVGGTRVDVQMSYTPPAGWVGHAVASFFGSNPRQAMDDDLEKLKTLLEQGDLMPGDGNLTRREALTNGTDI